MIPRFAPRWRFVFLVLLGALAIPDTPTVGQQPRLQLLRIGATGSLTGKDDGAEEEAGVTLLKNFIKEETGLANEIVPEHGWVKLTDMLAANKLQIVVFQGYEFAWAQERSTGLRPLALGVNGSRYVAAHVLVRQNNAARDFAGLPGQSLALPLTNQKFVRLAVDRQAVAAGKAADAYFSKITTPANAEDALDEVVDGTAQAAAVDGAALDAYRRRKPGRFSQLREVSRSQAFPPLVVAYYGTALDDATLVRFRNGLLGAARKKAGERLLMLSHLSGFEAVPADFAKVLADTRKTYPADKEK